MDKYKPSAPRGVFAVATVPLAASVALADPAPEGCSAIIPEPLFPEVRGARLNLTPSHVQSWEQLHSLCVTRGIPAARQRDSATFGWVPRLTKNPHQRRPVPEPVFDEVKTTVMDELVPMLVEKRIIEEILAPPASDFGDTFDPVLHWQDGFPYPVPRTTYSYTAVVFPVPKPGAAGRAVWAGKVTI